MLCKNCLSHNAPGATHCSVCRMPGDFGAAPLKQAPVVEQPLRDCTNCGGQAPAQAHKCPSCRWPFAPAPAATRPVAIRKSIAA